MQVIYHMYRKQGRMVVVMTNLITRMGLLPTVRISTLLIPVITGSSNGMQVIYHMYRKQGRMVVVMTNLITRMGLLPTVRISTLLIPIIAGSSNGYVLI
jgi:hypothetical protein